MLPLQVSGRFITNFCCCSCGSVRCERSTAAPPTLARRTGVLLSASAITTYMRVVMARKRITHTRCQWQRNKINNYSRSVRTQNTTENILIFVRTSIALPAAYKHSAVSNGWVIKTFPSLLKSQLRKFYR